MYFIELRTRHKAVIYLLHTQYTDITCAYFFNYTIRDFCCTEDFVRAVGAESRYLPPSSLVISDLQPCKQDNREYILLYVVVTVVKLYLVIII